LNWIGNAWSEGPMRVATVVVTSPLTKDSSQIRFIQWNKKVSRERIEQIRDEVKARNHSSQDNATAPVTIRMKLRCGHEENYRQDSILTRRFVGSAAQQYAEHAGVIVVEDVPSLLKANATRSSELWFATITSAVAPMRQCAYSKVNRASAGHDRNPAVFELFDRAYARQAVPYLILGASSATTPPAHAAPVPSQTYRRARQNRFVTHL
jgi:hypothetical protein